MKNYKIEEVRDRVFAVIMEDDYARPMTFLRVQEYYESPNEDFRGKHFNIWDYIEWYSRQKKDVFTYAKSKWDEVMKDIVWEVQSKMFNKKSRRDMNAYIIGAKDTENSTFQHEVAHGLYYTNKEYKQLMDEITETIEWQDYLKFEKNLLDMGYTAAVIPDEIQAYLSWGWDYAKFSKGVSKKLCKQLNKEYRKVFDRYL